MKKFKKVYECSLQIERLENQSLMCMLCSLKTERLETIASSHSSFLIYRGEGKERERERGGGERERERSIIAFTIHTVHV